MIAPFRGQLLKWIGSKQRVADVLVSYFPRRFNVYREPFLGSGAVLATLAPPRAVGSDVSPPLVEIWQTLRRAPEQLVAWYTERWQALMSGDRVAGYEKIRATYNARPNGADLLFLCRACYGGVVRFRLRDGHMSTPCGVHRPIAPETFAGRVVEWRQRTAGADFLLLDYAEALNQAGPGDLVYCDPPYRDSQRILYGAQTFALPPLFDAIARCKARGVHVALSLDRSKRSGDRVCSVPLPPGLFEREMRIACGRSMLRRFQLGGQTLEREQVDDRLLLTY